MSYNSSACHLTGAFVPEASVFVSANAGAGKTRLLTNRVLSLLLHGAPPSRILCLTFTNAAAAEMEERILGVLGGWVMEGDAALADALMELTGNAPDDALLARARSLFAAVLDAPEGVRIQTLHGFCQSLLRRFPIEAGVSPHFTVMDTQSEQALLAEARLRLCSRAQAEDAPLREALAAIARALGESGFNALVGEIVAQKRKLIGLLSPGRDAAREVWELLQLSPGSTEASLLEEHFSYDAKTLAALRRIAALLLTQGGAANERTGKGLADWLERPGHPDALEGYREAMFTSKGEKRKMLCGKNSLPDDSQLALLYAEQERAWRFADASRALDAARHTTHVLHLAEALLALYDAQKRGRALMDYDDLILTARGLLRQPGIAPWVLYKLDGGLDHILVDEAQDTSPEQWDIVDALTQEFFSGEGRAEGARSLFVVGDEKQSIFSFQGADPKGLGRMRRYFMERIRDAARPVHARELTRSYRSTPEVLAAVDAVFARPEARDGLTYDSEAEASVLTHVAHRQSYPGLVELWPLARPDEGGDEDAPPPVAKLARAVADAIQSWLKRGLWLEAKGRPVSAGDIMILVRTRTALVDRLVRALKRRGVPVAGHDRMALGDNLAVQDLMALGQCLLLPDDDLTLASALKSPIFGLSEDALFQLAWRRGGTLWERLRELGSQQGPFAQAVALIEDLRGRADYVSPYELYSYLLDRRGARQRFTGRMGVEYADPIDEFLGQALLYERAHASSLQGFLHWLEKSESEIRRDMEQSQGMVRIMTAHSSKGLQAPIVILPDTVRKPTMKESLLWHEGEGGALPFWPVSSTRDDSWCCGLRDRHKQDMLAEYRRLLYVALTRAEDHLYICGAAGKNTPAEDCWYELVRKGLEGVAAPVEMEGRIGLRVGTPLGPAKRAGAPAPKLAAPGADFAFLREAPPEEPSPPQPLAPSRLAGEEPASSSPLAAAGLYGRGILIHKLLQYLPDAADGERAAQAIARQYGNGLGDSERERCVAEAFAVLRHPRFAFLFGAGSLAEAPVAGCIEVKGKTLAVAGQIDRLYIGESEVWIADFKSNREPPGPGEPIPAAYLRQMQLYRLMLQAIYPGKTVRCALIWTASASIDALDDASLDEALASSYI